MLKFAKKKVRSAQWKILLKVIVVKKQLILNHFKFRIGSCNKGLICWRYTTKNCTAKVYTDENNICINNTDTPQSTAQSW